MQLEEIYNNNRKSLLFDDSIYIKNLKKKIINSFYLDPKILRNNESTKHFDQSIFTDLSYVFNFNDSKIFFNKNQDSIFTTLSLINGNLYNVENINEKILFIKILNEHSDFAEKKNKKICKYFFR